MEWLGQNWVWVLFMIGFVAMHLFGHCGHGSHGGHGDHKPEEGENPPRTTGEPRVHHH